MIDRYEFLRFSAIFLLTLLYSSAIPPFVINTKGWMKTFQCRSLFGCTFLFMLLVEQQKELIRIRLWGMTCDPYVENCFLIAIKQSSCRNVQPYIVCSIEFSFKIIFVDWQFSVGSIWKSPQTSLIIWTSASHWVVSYQKWTPSLHTRLWLRLIDILKHQGLSLYLLSRLVMSLILEKHFVVLEYFRCPWKLWNRSLLNYRLHCTFKYED